MKRVAISISPYSRINSAVRSANIVMIAISCPPSRGRTTFRKRGRCLSRRPVIVATIALLCTLLPGAAALPQGTRAANGTPARIDNIWGGCGFDHQPTESEIPSAERAHVVAPSTQERRREARIPRQLNREVLRNDGAGSTGECVLNVPVSPLNPWTVRVDIQHLLHDQDLEKVPHERIRAAQENKQWARQAHLPELT